MSNHKSNINSDIKSNSYESNTYKSNTNSNSPRIDLSNNDGKKLDLSERIANGQYGKVYLLGKSSVGNLDFVDQVLRREINSKHIKLNKDVLKCNYAPLTTDGASAVKEMDVLVRLCGHPYIVPLKEVVSANFIERPFSPLPGAEDTKRDNIHFVFPKAEFSLHMYIYDIDDDAYYKNIRRFMYQILLGLQYIHYNNIIHRDIKPQNILLFIDSASLGKSNELTAKICDFGMSRLHTTWVPTSPQRYSPSYRPAEVVLNHTNYGTEADMWSIGCLFYELVTKEVLINCDDTDNDILKNMFAILEEPIDSKILNNWLSNNSKLANIITSYNVKSNNSWVHRLNKWESNNTSNNNAKSLNINGLIKLLRKLICWSPQDRYTAKDALQDSYFDEFREEIIKCQSKYITDNKYEAVIFSRNINDSECISSVINDISNSKYSNYLYIREIFHAIDLYDRYVAWRRGHEDIAAEFPTDAIFMLIVYVVIKYFNHDFQISFWEIITNLYSTKATEFYKPEEFEKLEVALIEKVWKGRLYNTTLYEISEFNKLVNPDQLVDLLEFYLRETSKDDAHLLTAYSILDLYKKKSTE